MALRYKKALDSGVFAEYFKIQELVVGENELNISVAEYFDKEHRLNGCPPVNLRRLPTHFTDEEKAVVYWTLYQMLKRIHYSGAGNDVAHDDHTPIQIFELMDDKTLIAAAEAVEQEKNRRKL
jgi:hypothetical protein